VAFEKDLGVVFSNDLKVRGQCEEAYSKASQMLGLINRTVVLDGSRVHPTSAALSVDRADVVFTQTGGQLILQSWAAQPGVWGDNVPHFWDQEVQGVVQ